MNQTKFDINNFRINLYDPPLYDELLNQPLFRVFLKDSIAKLKESIANYKLSLHPSSPRKTVNTTNHAIKPWRGGGGPLPPMSPESYQQYTRSLQPSNGISPLQPRIWEVAPSNSAPLRSVPLSSMQFQSAATTSYTPSNGLIEQLYNAIDDRSTVDKFTTKYEDQLDGGGLLLAIGIGCIAIGATVSSLFTTIHDYMHPKYSYKDVYNCFGILNCHMYTTNVVITNNTLDIIWIKPPTKTGLYLIPFKGYAYYTLQKWSGINISNLSEIMTSKMQDYLDAQSKNIYILFIKNVGTVASVYDSYAIQIVMCWKGIDNRVNFSDPPSGWLLNEKL